MARTALDRVPTAPFDFRRTIYQRWVPLHPEQHVHREAQTVDAQDESRPAPGGAYTPTVPQAPTTHRRSWPSSPLRHRARPEHAETARPQPPVGLLADRSTGPSPARPRAASPAVKGAKVDKAGRMSFELVDGALVGGTVRCGSAGPSSRRRGSTCTRSPSSARSSSSVAGRACSVWRLDDQHEPGPTPRRVDIADVDLRGRPPTARRARPSRSAGFPAGPRAALDRAGVTAGPAPDRPLNDVRGFWLTTFRSVASHLPVDPLHGGCRGRGRVVRPRAHG